jgi:hypothetical protein
LHVRLKLHGPQGPSKPFAVRPFFHQLPKTPALDVQWTPGEPVLVAKYLVGKDTLTCWTGTVIESPASPPTGGCATRVLMSIDGVAGRLRHLRRPASRAVLRRPRRRPAIQSLCAKACTFANGN